MHACIHNVMLRWLETLVIHRHIKSNRIENMIIILFVHVLRTLFNNPMLYFYQLTVLSWKYMERWWSWRLACFLGEICFSISILLLHKALRRYYVLSNKSRRNSKLCLCGSDDNDKATRSDVRCCCHLKNTMFGRYVATSTKYKGFFSYIITVVVVVITWDAFVILAMMMLVCCLHNTFFYKVPKGIPETHFLYVVNVHSSALMIFSRLAFVLFLESFAGKMCSQRDFSSTQT